MFSFTGIPQICKAPAAAVNMHKLAVLLLPLLFLAGCNALATVGEPHYIKLRDCQNQNVCVYDYSSFLVHGVDIKAQNVTVSAKFKVFCESIGEYANERATKYCLDVTEGRLEHKGSNWNKTINLDQQLQMGKFCFAQNEDGKISVVFHSKDESQEAINFKKALVTGFQANFEGEAVVVETDQDTEHFSHYRHIETHTRSRHMVRHFDETDIAISADRNSRLHTTYSKREEIEYNEDRVLTRTRGETKIRIIPKETGANVQQSNSDVEEPILNRSQSNGSQGKRRRRRRGAGQPPQSFFPSVDLDHFSIESNYALQLVKCTTISSILRRRRDVPESGTESPLRASSSSHGGSIQTPKLNVTALLELIHQSPEDTKQLEALKNYLLTEDNIELGQAINKAIDYLNNVCKLSMPEDVATKLKLYQILASLSSSDAQQALLSCLEKVTDTTEWNTLVVNIGLSLTPTTGFVARLELLLNSGTVMNLNSLLLMYGATASRADVELQQHMVAYLTAQLQEHTGNTEYTVTLIQALGNSGSSQIVDILLGLINSDDRVDVQVAAISALRKRAGDSRVKRVFLEMLRSRNQSATIVSALTNTLLKSIGTVNGQTSLVYARALEYSSRVLNNSYISGLVNLYLHTLQKHDPRLRIRLRRDTGNWGLAGGEYKMIASYEDREEDSATYPKNSGHLWSRQLGVQGFNLQVAAGMFTGASESGKKSKILGRGVARVTSFGYALELVEVEVLREQDDGDSVKKHVLVSVGGYNSDTELPSSSSGPDILEAEENMELFVGPAKIDIHWDVHVHLDGPLRVNEVDTNNTNTFLAQVSLSPSVKVRMHASSQFNVMGTNGSTSLEGEVGYALEAEGSVTGCVSGPPAFSVSTAVSDKWPSGYIQLSSWFEPHVTVPCGFEQCAVDGAEDSAPVKRWAVHSKSIGKVWENSVSVGQVSDWGQCPTGARVQESQLQFWWEESNMGQGTRRPTNPTH